MCVPDLTVHTHPHTRIHLTVYFWIIGYWGRDRVMSAMTRLRAGQTEKFRFDSRQGQNYFFSPKCPDRFSPLFFLLFSGYRCAVPGAKLHGREADYSVPQSVEFRNGWSCTSISSCDLYRDNTLNFHTIFLVDSKVL